MSLSRKHFEAFAEDIKNLMQADMRFQEQRDEAFSVLLMIFVITSVKKILILIEIDLSKLADFLKVYILRRNMMTAKEMQDQDFISFQDDFYNLLEKYGVGSINIEHPQFETICNLRNKVAEFIEQEKYEED